MNIKIGYPCLNNSVGCKAGQRFILANYSEENLVKAVTNNLDCLERILEFNVQHDLYFFRISSDTVPFASHPVCQFDWADHFQNQLERIGQFIKEHDIRISMHPDQFVLLNAPNPDIVQKSLADLVYHCRLLDAMKLDTTTKVQIHVGGVYGEKPAAIERFIQTYRQLDPIIARRLAIENDDRLYSLQDCLAIHQQVGLPIIFDTFHHSLLNNGESLTAALKLASQTWSETDGHLMVDYSSQAVGERKGKHTDHIDLADFRHFLDQVKNTPCDVMLEIKDKEKSALEAVVLVKINS